MLDNFLNLSEPQVPHLYDFVWLAMKFKYSVFAKQLVPKIGAMQVLSQLLVFILRGFQSKIIINILYKLFC